MKDINVKRIIACLDIINERVVIGEQFENLQVIDDPLQLAQFYEQSSLDDLVIYDISGSESRKNHFLNLLQQINESTTMPLTVGGGLRTMEDIEKVFNAGADRISINSQAINDITFLENAVKTYGRARVVLAIDAKQMADGKWHAFTQGGKKDSGLDAFAWAKQAEAIGVAEIILNCIDTDGVRDGFHIPLNKKMAETVNIPIIASGGAGKIEHFSEVFQKTKVAGALAASIFHQQSVSIEDVKQYLREQNIQTKEF